MPEASTARRRVLWEDTWADDAWAEAPRRRPAVAARPAIAAEPALATRPAVAGKPERAPAAPSGTAEPHRERSALHPDDNRRSEDSEGGRSWADGQSWADGRSWAEIDVAQPRARRTVTIRGRGDDHSVLLEAQRQRRRPPLKAYERSTFRPDRVAMWAVVLGVLLVVVAATSSHAALRPARVGASAPRIAHVAVARSGAVTVPRAGAVAVPRPRGVAVARSGGVTVARSGGVRLLGPARPPRDI